MNSDKLKGRASYPFETIGVAIAFSPRLEPLLCESKILAEVFGAQLLLMHIGERTNTKEAKLDDLIRKIGIDQTKLRVIWHEGDPVHTILELCKLNIVDLLVVGAMQKRICYAIILVLLQEKYLELQNVLFYYSQVPKNQVLNLAKW